MFSMKCPKCGAESKFSFVNNSYEGPRRCWKCHELFKMKILNNVLIYCEPLSEEEFKKLQEINALKSKLRNQPSD
jgi:NAD-dependent SIR2 family protein deacetylase